MRFAVLLFGAMSVWLSANAASADQWWHIGELTCEGNRAVVRFGGAVEGHPRFPDLPAELVPFSVKPAVGNTCKLADGREVKVRIGGTQIFPYGECGSGRNSFSSLWIDERKVLSRQWVKHDCFAKGYADVFYFDGSRLFLCVTRESLEGLRGDDLPVPGCVEATDNLKYAQRDGYEYLPASLPPKRLGEVEIAFANNQAFCSAFLTDGPVSGSDDTAQVASTPDSFQRPWQFRAPWSAPELQMRSQDDIAGFDWFRMPAFAELPQFRGTLNDAALGVRWATPLSDATFDFDNDGADDWVFRASADGHAFDGDIFFVASTAEQTRHVASFLHAPPGVDPTGDGRKRFRGLEQAYGLLLGAFERWGLPRYTGGTPGLLGSYQDRYTYQTVFRYEGQTFVFAAPLNRALRPTAIVYRPLHDGNAAPECIFQRVEESY